MHSNEDPEQPKINTFFKSLKKKKLSNQLDALYTRENKAYIGGYCASEAMEPSSPGMSRLEGVYKALEAATCK